MNIPDKAHTAALEAEYEWNADKRPRLSRVEYMLQAAAPFIAAQALRDAARVAMSYEEDGGLRPDEYNTGRYDLMWDVQEWLDTRANELDPQ